MARRNLEESDPTPTPAPHEQGDSDDALVHRLMRDPIIVSRVFFVLLATLIGCYVGIPTRHAIEFSMIGFLLGGLFVLTEHATNFVSSKSLLFAATGAFLGLIFSSLIHPVLRDAVETLGADHDGVLANAVPLTSHLVFCYLGVALALRHVDRFSFSRLNFILSRPAEPEKVIDSSILIDGRIIDIIETNFLTGPFVVPEFVLNELQRLADSSKPVKRQRGRRALDTLETLRNRIGQVRLDSTDFGRMPVDQKLLHFTRQNQGILMTTDYNLQKVAQIHQVRTLNINELANMLKPSAFVGEEIRIHLDRPGKEASQAVGYLDDGTMVIVEDARALIGKDVIVEVTSVLQNPTGRLIFARLLHECDDLLPEADEGEEGRKDQASDGKRERGDDGRKERPETEGARGGRKSNARHASRKMRVTEN